MSKELDLSPVPEGERLGEIIKNFEASGPNEPFTIRADDNFFSLIAGLQERHWKEFYWTPVLAGPPSWQGEIEKKREDQPGFGGIFEFMSRDHARCDKLYAEGEAAGRDGNWEAASERLHAFLFGMEHHFTMEETVFFPAFEQEMQMTEGPTAVMRMEHEQMRELLKEMKENLDSGNNDRALGVGETLLVLMQQHNMKEEQMLYPMSDMHLSHIMDDLLKKMQRVGA